MKRKLSRTARKRMAQGGRKGGRNGSRSAKARAGRKGYAGLVRSIKGIQPTVI